MLKECNYSCYHNSRHWGTVSDTYNLKEKMGSLVHGSGDSVQGWLALKHRHHGGRAWRRKDAELMVTGDSTREDDAMGAGADPVPPLRHPAGHLQECALLINTLGCSQDSQVDTVTLSHHNSLLWKNFAFVNSDIVMIHH